MYQDKSAEKNILQLGWAKLGHVHMTHPPRTRRYEQKCGATACATQNWLELGTGQQDCIYDLRI